MKTVIVTGASKGIGRETALKFANNNFKVIAIARDIDLLEKNLNSKVKKNDYETIRNCIENGEKNNINMDNKNKKYSLKIK